MGQFKKVLGDFVDYSMKCAADQAEFAKIHVRASEVNSQADIETLVLWFFVVQGPPYGGVETGIYSEIPTS